MQRSFDVVITTYNRHYKVSELINRLLELADAQRILGNIILVDSSLITYAHHSSHTNLRIVHSSHRNQPYQRFLGASVAQRDYVLFLDDDMQIIDDSFCEDMLQYIDRSLAGVNLKFNNNNLFLNALEKSVVPKGNISSLLRKFSGYPRIQNNKAWLTGIKGDRTDGYPVEFVSGGSFFAKRKFLYDGLSTTLFDAYEKGLGKGEDMITGFALSQKGMVYAHDKVYFLHNDQQNSVYTANHYLFSRRVAYSRLLLSFEYSKLTRSPLFITFLHYVWYTFFRLAGMFLNFVLNPGLKRKRQITGYIAGVFLAIFRLAPQYLLKRENINLEYWIREISSDI